MKKINYFPDDPRTITTKQYIKVVTEKVTEKVTDAKVGKDCPLSLSQ